MSILLRKSLLDYGQHETTFSRYCNGLCAIFTLEKSGYSRNFLGGGVWGFMITLPQINLYAHGTQWTVSHGHFAFWGAYACGVLSVIYLVVQKLRSLAQVDGALWKWSF